MKRLFTLALGAACVATLLAGCGGSGKGSQNGEGATGSARVSVYWPAPSRLIPAAANSITVTLSRGDRVLGAKMMARPAGGEGETTASFGNLPVGDVAVSASAFPKPDGTGVPQAKAAATATIVSGQTASIALTLASTITQLQVTPPTPSCMATQSVQLKAQAMDASNRIVLTAPGKLTWQSLNPAIATVDADGLVRGLAVGATSITATETESGQSATVPLNVSKLIVDVGPIYAVDNWNGCIVRMDDISGRNWKSLGSMGSGPNQFNAPGGVAVDSQHRIYIADTQNQRIVRVNDISGAGWTTFGTFGTGQGQFFDVGAIAIGPDDKIYMTDYDRLIRMDDMSGTGWTELAGSPTNTTDRFSGLTHLAVARDGSIYVADTNNDRIVRVSDISGAGWAAYGVTGSSQGRFSRPGSVAVDSTGRIYIADTGNNRLVRVSDMTGSNWIAFTLPAAGSGAAPFPQSGVSDVFVSSNDLIYVADTRNARVVRLVDMNATQMRAVGSFSWQPGMGRFTYVFGVSVR